MIVCVHDSHFGIQKFKISLKEWIKLHLGVDGTSVYAFHARKEGWSGELPFYIVKCGRHGYFLDYLHGFSGYNEGFNCPFCLEETVGWMKHETKRNL
jgi:hypothetical protein